MPSIRHSREPVDLSQETRRPSSVLSACPRTLSVAGCALLLLLVATCQVDKLTNNPPPVATLSVVPTQLNLDIRAAELCCRPAQWF